MECPRKNNACGRRPYDPFQWFHNEGENLIAAHSSQPDRLASDSSAVTDSDMAATESAIYATPGPGFGGMVPSASTISSDRSPDGSASSGHEALLDPPPPPPQRTKSDLRANCEKLERSNRRMKIVFWALIVACVLVLLVYVVVIACLFVELGRRRHSGGEEEGPAVASGKADCVHEDEIKAFKNIWDPEDRKDVMDLLEDSGFVFTSTTRTYCFSNLQWVPQIMAKISSRVLDSVSYIEDQQKKINQTVSFYTSANNTGSQCAESGKRKPSTQDPADPMYSVYAHYFLDLESQRPDSVVRWTREGQKLSSRNRVDVSNSNGQFIIKDSGFYYVYSHLVFKQDSREMVHNVFKTRESEKTKLLESVRGPASFLQGVFRLRTNDRLTVEANKDRLDRSRERVSYFGVYLIRT